MLFRKDHVVLERLKEEDIELVRRWRNCKEISQYMEFREHITPAMQKAWFKSIDNVNNFYLLIHHKGKKIGLANGKSIDWEKRTIEGGIFIWDKSFQDTEIPVFVFILLGELLVNVFHLDSYGRILKNNQKARRFNTMLGYELCEGQENKENQLYRITREMYLKKADYFRKTFLSIGKGNSIEVVLENHEYEDGYANFIENQMDLSAFREIRRTEEGKLFKM